MLGNLAFKFMRSNGSKAFHDSISSLSRSYKDYYWCRTRSVLRRINLTAIVVFSFESYLKFYGVQVLEIVIRLHSRYSVDPDKRSSLSEYKMVTGPRFYRSKCSSASTSFAYIPSLLSVVTQDESLLFGFGIQSCTALEGASREKGGAQDSRKGVRLRRWVLKKNLAFWASASPVSLC